MPPLAVLPSGTMSEKRQRQQQRRQRRKAAGRPPSNGTARSTRRNDTDRELAELMTDLAAIAARGAAAPSSALEAELWAASIVGTWHVRPLPGYENVEDVFFPGFTAALEQLATAQALATLRALSAVGADIHGRRARAAADRLAASGVIEAPWARELGQARPTAAALMYEDTYDDGVSVLVEFADAEAEPHTLGIYIDHNMGCLVKDAFVAGPLSDVRGELERQAATELGPRIRDFDLAEARARVEAALYMLDHTYDPPVSDDVRMLRALIDTRMRLLPAGFELADDFTEMTPEARDELLADFLDSPEGRHWRGDEDAEDVAGTAIDFGAGYNHGGPLRWSPVVVEIFMTSWLPRKVAREPEFFKHVPDVLRDWVAYAGRHRAVPPKPLHEATGAVKRYGKEMLEAAIDPEAWGPAKTFAVTAQQAGVDLSDPKAVQRFIDEYNAGLAV
jgi:hypothetical protein